MKAKICVIIFIKLNSVAPIHKTKIVPLQGIELICTKMDLSGDYNEGGWGWNDGVGGRGYSQASLLSKLLMAIPNAWTAHRG